MFRNNIQYSYKDITVIPADLSDIKSRSECNPYTADYHMPIFTAPMSSVVNEENYAKWHNNHIIPILPRNIDLSVRIDYSKRGQWAAFSLNEFYEVFCNENKTTEPPVSLWYALIDVANGHMKQLYDMVKKAKSIHGKGLIVMVGNIANPETYKECVNAGVDYVRVGIGAGNGCFVNGTLISTKDSGYKKIEDVEVGEEVLTHDGTYQLVLNKLRYNTSEDKLCINNNITCTKDHKFFVINKKDKDLVNDSNLTDYGYWVEAQNLDSEKHFLIKRLEEEKDV